MASYLLVLLLACSGCSSLDGIFALKAFSDEQDAQEASVRAQDKRYDALRQQAQAQGRLGRYVDKSAVIRAFGEPAFCRPQGVEEQCVYHRMANPAATPKFYFYFDAAGKHLRSGQE